MILQQTGFLESNHSLFPITGFLGNPGQLGGFQAVALTATLLLVRYVRKYKSVIIVSAVLIGYSLLVSDSRAGWIAAISGVAMIYGKSILTYLKRHRYLWVAIVLSFVGLVVLLYCHRPGSADARMLVWRVSMGMFADNPITGVGIGHFRQEYMLYQADYFANHPDSSFVMVADNVAYPYNEFIRIAVEQGVIGISLLFLLLLMSYFNLNEKSCFAPLASLLAFSLFSYPSYKILLAVLFPVTLGITCQFTFFSGKIRTVLLSLSVVFVSLLSVGVYCCFRKVSDEMEMLARQYDSGSVNNIKRHTPLVQNHIRLNALFLHIVGEHPLMQTYDNISLIIPTCENWCEIGRLYMQRGNFADAEKYFLQAADMIPTRLLPKYLLWKLYIAQDRSADADAIAKIIINQPIKVENTTTLKIKYEIIEFYREKHHCVCNGDVIQYVL